MVTIIAAVSQNNCIGKDGSLPWHLPEDMKHFKELTMGHPVIMGRKTWESIPEKFRPLPGRLNVVVTRQPDYALPEGVEHAASLDDALTVHTAEDVFVIGGATVYADAMPKADRLEITRVEQTVDGDTFFPEIASTEWREIARQPHEGFAFVTYDRIR
jgi:dihydrofolate reductase